MLKFNKKVIKGLSINEINQDGAGLVAGGHDFQPSGFRGCQSKESFALPY